ncbi:MAG: hypothetical protein JWL95_2816, partial [Gemmatimonadetes bacterium]|nr:hypothetical protein [Gemmatimonadota bacterium]
MTPAALAGLDQLTPMTRETQATKRCTGCTCELPIDEFGVRRDGRENTRCTACRRAQAQGGGWMSARKRRDARPVTGPRDVRALRAVERYSGFHYRRWLSPEAKRW